MKSTYVLWRGNSVHNGERIRLVATNIVSASVNTKIGPMVQLWILPDTREKLTELVKDGRDESVCGDCALRPFLAAIRRKAAKEAKETKKVTKCYVRVYQAPNSIHKSTHDREEQWLEGWNAIKASRRRVRVGAYGGIDALPEEVALGVMQKIRSL